MHSAVPGSVKSANQPDYWASLGAIMQASKKIANNVDVSAYFLLIIMVSFIFIGLIRLFTLF